MVDQGPRGTEKAGFGTEKDKASVVRARTGLSSKIERGKFRVAQKPKKLK